MADFGFSVAGSNITTQVTYVTTAEDADRIIAYGMRRFGTQDLQTVVERFAEVFMGGLRTDAKADEQRLAAIAAQEAVTDIVATPKVV